MSIFCFSRPLDFGVSPYFLLFTSVTKKVLIVLWPVYKQNPVVWLFKQNPSSAFCLTGALFPTHLDNEVVIDKELVGIFYFLCSFLKLGKEWRTATLKNFQPTFCQIEVIVLRRKVCKVFLFLPNVSLKLNNLFVHYFFSFVLF